MQLESKAAAADAKRLLAPFEKDVVALATELVRTNSVNVPPNGSETAAQLVLEEFLAAHGVRSELYSLDLATLRGHRYFRSDREYGERKNLAVHLEGSGRGKSVLLNGHIDTVPTDVAGWKHDPWSGEIRQGRLYGLGSFDMKGGVAAQAAVVAALRSAGVALAGDVLFESVIDEEWGGGGGTLAAVLRGARADAAVISEGTQLDVLRATRGGFVVDLKVEAGDPSAYFSEQPVVSPAVPLGRLLGWVDEWTAKRAALQTTGAYVAVADPAPVQVLAVEANRLDPNVPLSVPLAATVRMYVQFLPDEDVDAVLGTMRQSLEEFEQGDAFFGTHRIQWKPLYDPPLLGHELPESHPWTQCLASAVEVVCGKRPRIGAAPYPCDAFLLQREFGIPTLLFGPAGAGAHNPGEYVETDSIIKTAESLLAAVLSWCG